MTVVRTHDAFYLHEDRYDDPKDAFVFCARLAREAGCLAAGRTICDFGCAAGEFLYYLRTVAPDAVLRGYDVLPDLLDKARRRVTGVTFLQGSVCEAGLLDDASTDTSFMIGVHSIFDDLETPLDNLIRWTRPGGRVFVFGMFNQYPVDVFVKYRLSKDRGSDALEAGWNVFSMASASAILDTRQRVRWHRFHDFEISVDLAPKSDDPLRSWTIRDASGRRLIVNGTSLYQQLKVLEIALDA